MSDIAGQIFSKYDVNNTGVLQIKEMSKLIQLSYEHAGLSYQQDSSELSNFLEEIDRDS